MVCQTLGKIILCCLEALLLAGIGFAEKFLPTLGEYFLAGFVLHPCAGFAQAFGFNTQGINVLLLLLALLFLLQTLLDELAQALVVFAVVFFPAHSACQCP